MFFLALPSALSYGMTEGDFWYGRPWLYAAYAEKQRREMRTKQWERWQLGAYVYDAIQRNATILNPLAKKPTPAPWPDVPYGMETEKQEEKREKRKEDAVHAQIIDQLLTAFK